MGVFQNFMVGSSISRTTPHSKQYGEFKTPRYQRHGEFQLLLLKIREAAITTDFRLQVLVQYLYK